MGYRIYKILVKNNLPITMKRKRVMLNLNILLLASSAILAASISNLRGAHKIFSLAYN